MKRTLRTALIVLLLVVLAASLVAVCSAWKKDSSLMKCSELKIEFTDNFNFVSEDDIKSYLDTYYGNILGKALDSINLAKIEKVLDVQSAILKSEAYTTSDGVLNILISQREPIVRFQKGTSGFYIDDRGFIFPLQSNYTSHVPVIDGEIPLRYSHGYKGQTQNNEDKQWMEDVINLVKYIQKHKQWTENIVQISVDANGDFLLVPRIGKEVFNFGAPVEIEKKFAKIERYYQYIQPLGKDYSNVSVKYDKQIICK